MRRAPDSSTSPALEPLYRYIDRLAEPDRVLFVLDLQRYLMRRPDAGFSLMLRRPAVVTR